MLEQRDGPYGDDKENGAHGTPGQEVAPFRRVHVCRHFHHSSSGSQRSMNSSGTATVNSFAMRSASGRLGSYLSVSTALIVCRETPSRRASSPWLHPRPSRTT